MTALRALLLAALATAALPAAAHAAYAPKLELRLEPATPKTASAVTLTLRQAAGESPSKTQVIRYPRELRFNPAFSVQGCRRPEEDAQACPESSRIGTVSAETEFGPFAGAVYLTDDFRMVIFLRGFAGLVQSKIAGEVRVTADGSVETVLDNLPAARSTFAQVRLDGGPRSLVLTPSRCGSYPVRGRFTSHQGEQATSDTAIEVTGCEGRQTIKRLKARRRGRAVAVSWIAAAEGPVRLRLERRVRTRPYERWRKVAVATAVSRKGANGLRLRRPGGGRLRRGTYRLTLRSLAASGRVVDTRRAQLRVR